ncbi:hypothetical protein GH733_006773, partial [Mirounga leonina]
MAPWTFWRCCQRSVGWVPVLFITFVVVWSYYAYVVELCVCEYQAGAGTGRKAGPLRPAGLRLPLRGRGGPAQARGEAGRRARGFVTVVRCGAAFGRARHPAPSRTAPTEVLAQRGVTLSGNGENGKAVVYLVAFHLFFVMFVWSYWMTIFTSPASPSKEFYLPSSEKERYEKEFSQERQQEILKRAARDLPIYTTSASRILQYFIKFWTNELSDTRAKFHVLFLFFVSTMFFVSVLSLFSYHCWLVGKNRTTIGKLRICSKITSSEVSFLTLQ